MLPEWNDSWMPFSVVSLWTWSKWKTNLSFHFIHFSFQFLYLHKVLQFCSLITSSWNTLLLIKHLSLDFFILFWFYVVPHLTPCFLHFNLLAHDPEFTTLFDIFTTRMKANILNWYLKLQTIAMFLHQKFNKLFFE